MIVLLLPPYRFHESFDLLLPVSGLVFLAFYFARSRYAWHVLAAELLIVTPAYVSFSFSWRLQRAMHPWIIWVPIVGTVLIAALLLGRGGGILHILSSGRQPRGTSASSEAMERTLDRIIGQ